MWVGSRHGDFNYFTENYKFRNYGFKGSFVTDDILKKFEKLNLSQIIIDNCPLVTKDSLHFFKKCDTITITASNNIVINDDILILFSNCKKIIINSRNTITKNGLKILEKCQEIGIRIEIGSYIFNRTLSSYNNLHTVRLRESPFGFCLTIESVQYLSNIKNLDLRGLNILDSHVQYFTSCCYLNLSYCIVKCTTLHLLKNLHTVILDYCQYITNDILKQLGHLTVISLVYCSGITDDGLYFLRNIYKLNLKGCRITDTGVKMLGNVHKLNIARCEFVTDKSIKKLKRLHTLIIDGCIQITNKPVYFLTDCHFISVKGCYKITLKRSNIVYDCSYAWDDELLR